MKTGKCCALKLLNNPGGARLQGESSGEGGYNTCEDLPRPGYYFSIFNSDCKFWFQIITLIKYIDFLMKKDRLVISTYLIKCIESGGG